MSKRIMMQAAQTGDLAAALQTEDGRKFVPTHIYHHQEDGCKRSWSIELDGKPVMLRALEKNDEASIDTGGKYANSFKFVKRSCLEPIVTFRARGSEGQFEWARLMDGQPLKVLEAVGSQHVKVKSDHWPEPLVVEVSDLNGYQEWLTYGLTALADPHEEPVMRVGEFQKHAAPATHIYLQKDGRRDVREIPVVILGVHTMLDEVIIWSSITSSLRVRPESLKPMPMTELPAFEQRDGIKDLNPFKMDLNPVPAPEVVQDAQDLVRFTVPKGWAARTAWAKVLREVFGICYGDYDKNMALSITCRLDQYGRFAVMLEAMNNDPLKAQIIEARDRANVFDVSGR